MACQITANRFIRLQPANNTHLIVRQLRYRSGLITYRMIRPVKLQ
ncbi:hypothetical protein HMPREF0973_00102 [Prevotella veroralis F0319]|uniref:Uncharacterized protein n=1 Tax=Prevotella veroralis F0319 TaxID=649761 RepID=C9MKJ4_9BACT|nr:hypothetical protein HMPREF0973_00102 [Prevotella veroralis F0319]